MCSAVVCIPACDLFVFSQYNGGHDTEASYPYVAKTEKNTQRDDETFEDRKLNVEALRHTRHN